LPKTVLKRSFMDRFLVRMRQLVAALNYLLREPAFKLKEENPNFSGQCLYHRQNTEFTSHLELVLLEESFAENEIRTAMLVADGFQCVSSRLI
jgi:hypothetical protein